MRRIIQCAVVATTLAASVSTARATSIVVTMSGSSDSGLTQSIAFRALLGASKGLFQTVPTVGDDARTVRDDLVEENGIDAASIDVKRVTVEGLPGFKSSFAAEHQVRIVTALGLTLLEPGTALEFDGIIYRAFDLDIEMPTAATAAAPTVSQWGLIVLAVLIAIAGTVLFREKHVPQSC